MLGAGGVTFHWPSVLVGIGIAFILPGFLVVAVIACVQGWCRLQRWWSDRKAERGRRRFDLMFSVIQADVERQRALLKDAALNPPPQPLYRSADAITVEGYLVSIGWTREVDA